MASTVLRMTRSFEVPLPVLIWAVLKPEISKICDLETTGVTESPSDASLASLYYTENDPGKCTYIFCKVLLTERKDFPRILKPRDTYPGAYP